MIDYGCNNGDQTYRHKIDSAKAYMNFLQQQSRSSSSGGGDDDMFTIINERASSGKGVYGVKVFDFTRQKDKRLLSDEEAGIEPSTLTTSSSTERIPLSDRSVAIFLLDIRTNKTPWSSTKKKNGEWFSKFFDRFQPNFEGDFLGQEQWEWLETSLKRSTATVNILVNGLQVHADRFWDGNMVEDWARFPLAQHRLYNTILKSNVSSPILVSGDVHMSELLRKDCKRQKDARFDKNNNNDDDSDTVADNNTRQNSRMLLEVTTSGMTHSWGTNICARPHSYSCQSKHVARSLNAGMHLAHWNGAWTDVVDLSLDDSNNNTEEVVATKTRYQYTLERNFGEFEFDWDNEQVVIRIFGYNGSSSKPVVSTRWDFDTLSGRYNNGSNQGVGQNVPASDYERLYQRLVIHTGSDDDANDSTATLSEDDWICINYRGHPSLLLKVFGFVSPIATAGFLMFSPMIAPLTILLLWLHVFIRQRRQKRRKQQQGNIDGKKKVQ